MGIVDVIFISLLLIFNALFSYACGITRGRNQVREELILSKRQGKLDSYLEEFMEGKK